MIFRNLLFFIGLSVFLGLLPPLSSAREFVLENHYDILISHSDSLKIKYEKIEGMVHCWVEREKGSLQQTSEVEVVQLSRFSSAPLQHCLSEKTVRQWLRNSHS